MAKKNNVKELQEKIDLLEGQYELMFIVQEQNNTIIDVDKFLFMRLYIDMLERKLKKLTTT